MNGKQRLKTGLHRSFWSYLVGICIDMGLRWVLLVTWIVLTWSSGRCTFSVWNWHKRLFLLFHFCVHLLYSVLYLVLLPPNIPSWMCLGPDMHIVCLLGLAKMGGSEVLLTRFLKLVEDLQSTIFINYWDMSFEGLQVLTMNLPGPVLFVARMALHRAEDHVITLRHFSLGWILSFCLFVF